MAFEKRGRLTFLYCGNTFVRKGVNLNDLGARLRDEVYIELALLCNKLDIRIYSLEAEDGTWPLEEEAAAVQGHEIKYSRSIASLFPGIKGEGRVHFRVEVQTLPLVQPATSAVLPSKIPIVSASPALTPLSLPTERFPLSLFADHRLKLNQVLAKIRKGAAAKHGKVTGKRRRDQEHEYGVSSDTLEWEDVEDIYDPLMQEDAAAFPVKKLDKEFIQKLVTLLQDERKAFGSTKRATSVRRLQQSVTTMIGAVATLFEDSFAVKMKPQVTDELVLTSGKPDLLITRRKRSVVVVVCLRENQLRSQAKELALMDVVIANGEHSTVTSPVFGIVSTFSDWVFYRYDETGIKYLEESLNDNERSIKGDIATIAGIIYNIMDGQ
ncbi:unnamed protein product [Phytophthora fragariaefolia]|uniref:Unnamed protein product n=1 Tax=Phytophthora fragariaefolia TaxID=1490495 RepID=A0A9W6U6G3_9STRA|nr:unnamed protein product [Phytophthora fragariaefolia]